MTILIADFFGKVYIEKKEFKVTALELEKKSSAVSLSDMEIFVFPEIMYSLLLANLMSPVIWNWRDDPWFSGILDEKPHKRVLRLRQYIMDHYAFNLDLDTWGLTTKEKELSRFRDFVNIDILKQSNALFGYEGDRYYYDMDIRRHFGLDKYDSEAIPYWKTETVEAMDAFRFREGYESGAGECVSLATLYAAGLIIICQIPPEDIFLMATPLHSQNFVLQGDGILTNNRRIVTRNMWVNGTELSAKARRALEHERVTIVSHMSGHVHVMYKEATIDTEAFNRFSVKLNEFLYNRVSPDLLSNFLRYRGDFQKCFQIRQTKNGQNRWIELEEVFAYEHTSNNSVTGASRKNLLDEIESEDYSCCPIPHRIVLNDLEDVLKKELVMPDAPGSFESVRKLIDCRCFPREEFIASLTGFCHVKPRLPDLAVKKRSAYKKQLKLTAGMTREEIITHLMDIRDGNPLAEYAFHAFRDISTAGPEPFIKTAVERNPVCIKALEKHTLEDAALLLKGFPDESIYAEPNRLAQPDEVWNSGRGDGLEKVILLGALARNRYPEKEITIKTGNPEASARIGKEIFTFPSAKSVRQEELVL
jgi:hypothetical protein